MYACGTHNHRGPAATALAVASAVGTCNLLFGKFCDWVNFRLFPNNEGYDANGFNHFPVEHGCSSPSYGSGLLADPGPKPR